MYRESHWNALSQQYSPWSVPLALNGRTTTKPPTPCLQSGTAKPALVGMPYAGLLLEVDCLPVEAKRRALVSAIRVGKPPTKCSPSVCESVPQNYSPSHGTIGQNHLKGQRIPRSLLRGGICRERERGYNPLLWKLNSAAIVCIRSGITWSCASSTASRCFGKRSIGKPWWRRCGRLASGIGMRSRRWERTGIMCMCLLGRAGVGRRRGLCK